MTKTRRKDVFLRDMPVELIREAKAVAAKRGAKLSTIVAEALAHSLGVAGSESDADLDLDMRWFERNRERLARRYAGAYLAIVDQEVIDHDADFDALATRVFAARGNQSVYMPAATAAPTLLRVRSPRLTP